MNDLISVIVPVYNVEKYLRRCIDSIVNQSYTNLDIILVDDGSTDKSGLICDEYEKADSRITVIHKENGGLSDARNTGIEESNGIYLCFIDSDDYIMPDMINKLYNALTINNADISLCNFLYVDENEDEIRYRNEDLPIQDEVLNKSDVMNKMAIEKYWYYIIACNKLYKKELFLQIRFPYGKQHEDEFVAHLIFDKCERIACIKEPLYNYVQRDNSIMGRSINIKRLDAAEAFLNRAEFAVKKGYKKPAQASVSMAAGTIGECYMFLDIKNIDVKNRLCEIKSRYDIVYKNLNIKEFNFKVKIKCMLLFYSPWLFRVIYKLKHFFN